MWAALPLGVTPRTTVLSEFVINLKILSVKLMKSLKKKLNNICNMFIFTDLLIDEASFSCHLTVFPFVQV